MTYQLHRISVLVVEDNAPMLEITKSLLLTFGVGSVISAANGDIGFRRFCQYNPDIIIADWMMEMLNGIDLTERIRNNPASPNPYVPVILMTGFSEKDRVLHARDSGVTEFLVKPFTAQDLYKRITQVIERPRQFVRSGDFFGPDRRRKNLTEYFGPKRRDADEIPTEQVLKEQQQEANVALQKMRDHAGLEKGDSIDLTPEGKSLSNKRKSPT